jgi:hypothetical protein
VGDKVLRGPWFGAVLMLLSLLANVCFMSWGHMDALFVDQSYPAEHRLGTATIVVFLVLCCAVLAGMLGLLLSASQRLNPPVRTALKAVLFTAFWAVGAMMFAGWMITENAGATWLWHEPFTELFWHPIFTPVVFLTALMLALRDGTLR